MPAAFAMTMIGGATMRHMILPPLLLLAIWAAAAAAWEHVPDRRLPAFAVHIGIGCASRGGSRAEWFRRSSCGFVGRRGSSPSMDSGSTLGPAGVLSSPLSSEQCFRGRVGLWPQVCWWWRAWPLASPRATVTAMTTVQGWIPGLGAVALLAAALASWPGLGLSNIFPDHGWLARDDCDRSTGSHLAVAPGRGRSGVVRRNPGSSFRFGHRRRSNARSFSHLSSGS